MPECSHVREVPLDAFEIELGVLAEERQTRDVAQVGLCNPRAKRRGGIGVEEATERVSDQLKLIPGLPELLHGLLVFVDGGPSHCCGLGGHCRLLSPQRPPCTTT